MDYAPWFLIEWVVGVTVGIECIESGAIVRVERQPEFDTLWQVRIRKEMTPDPNQVTVHFPADRPGTLRSASHPSSHFPFKHLAPSPRRHAPLTLRAHHAAS